MSVEITISCEGCGNNLGSLASAPLATDEQFRTAVKKHGYLISCGACGSNFRTVDDEVDVSSGGSIALAEESCPRLTGLDVVTGPAAGGTVVRLTGKSFDVAGLVVKFDGIPGTGLSVVDAQTVDVTTPAGRIELVLAKHCVKLTHGAVTSGPFLLGETVTGSASSATATVKETAGGHLVVDSCSGPFTDGESLTGGASGASATLTTTVFVLFQVGETVTGGTSGQTGVVDTLIPLKVTSPSGEFSAGEDITGDSSAARATLHATSPMNGKIAVAVVNSFGHFGSDKVNHGTVTGEFAPGERITGGTSGSAAFVRQALRGTGFVLADHATGHFVDGETLTGDSSGAIATASSPSMSCLLRSGFTYTP